jgi:hypothetical protein
LKERREERDEVSQVVFGHGRFPWVGMDGWMDGLKEGGKEGGREEKGRQRERGEGTRWKREGDEREREKMHRNMAGERGP